MKVVLNIVAAVLIAAGFVVAVASLLTPGQVILGIDFKLAATLVIGGLILHALARALALLERMSNDLRQLRKAGSEAPPWLRESAGQSGIQTAAAMALAEGAAPPETARQGPAAEPAQEVGQDIGEQPAARAQAEWPHATESEWPEVSEVQWLETPEPEAPTTAEPEMPEPAREEERELPFPEAPAPAPQAEFEQEVGLEPEPEPLPEEDLADASEAAREPEPAEPAPVDHAEVPGEPAPSEPVLEDDLTTPGEPEPAEAAPEDYTEPSQTEPWQTEPEEAAHEADAELPRRLKPPRDVPWSPEEPAETAAEPEAPQAHEPAPEEEPALYVVEERMFRGKQARVLSDGTVEAETAEGWMRFEDFDHLEEYLDAMAELGR